jgi:prepilin-type N-terminal cleavage/methylation domain-containing protein
MCRHPDSAAAHRTGFTLVEMMVVLVLILIVGALAVLFVPRVNERQKAAKGADQLQQALLVAKMRALRDQAPRGVRIQPIPIVVNSGSAVTAAMIASQSSGTPVTILCQTSGTTEKGLAWNILPNSLLVVYDPDPVPPPQGEPELFTNLEVIRVNSVAPTGFTSFTFQQPHLAGFRIKVLAYAQELQFIEQPEDYFAQPGLGGAGTIRSLATWSATYGSRSTIPWLASITSDNQILVLDPLPTPPTPLPSPMPGEFTGGNYFVSSPTAAVSQALWPVQSGDYIEVQRGPMRRIGLLISGFGTVGVTNRMSPIPGTNPPRFEGDVLVLENPLPQSLSSTTDYRIVRSPRVLPGEAPVQLPDGVAIDLRLNTPFTAADANAANAAAITLNANPPLPFPFGNRLSPATPGRGNPFPGPLPIDPRTGQMDILFAPGGGLTGRGVGNDKVVLWVRDIALDSPFEGGPTLIAIYSRTGFIAAHPVDSDNLAGDYASYTRDGRSSGL